MANVCLTVPILDNSFLHVLGVINNLPLFVEMTVEDVPRVIDIADSKLLFHTLLLQSKQHLILSLHQCHISRVLYKARTLHNLVAPHKRILLVFLS
jgi:hypothetical protein